MTGRQKIVMMLLAALAIAWIGYSLLGPAGESTEGLELQIRQMERKNEQLAEQNRILSRKIEALKTRTDYLERLVRERLGLVKKGELVLKLNVPEPGGEETGGGGKGSRGRPEEE
ncbi:MAG: septum formation initiator family protein [Deltaproteobacteria bacterium]|nr:MAG: septum formation initiator family protein [Deltaproteobacteria bacterium]